MLVDMNTVPQCMVVSSTLSSVRLPINPNAPDGRKLLVPSSRLLAAADLSRYADSLDF